MNGPKHWSKIIVQCTTMVVSALRVHATSQVRAMAYIFIANAEFNDVDFKKDKFTNF
jgi:Na+-translocating ferredoxin:NAD+ oxidoreductase RnfE subunit